eukprot:scaffold12234_cov112-Isochrysis_galbana.AAC.2
MAGGRRRRCLVILWIRECIFKGAPRATAAPHRPRRATRPRPARALCRRHRHRGQAGGLTRAVPPRSQRDERRSRAQEHALEGGGGHP